LTDVSADFQVKRLAPDAVCPTYTLQLTDD
jgi:hypothetical protein